MVRPEPRIVRSRLGMPTIATFTTQDHGPVRVVHVEGELDLDGGRGGLFVGGDLGELMVGEGVASQ